MHIGLHVKYPSFLSYFNETWIFSTGFEKSSNIKFQESPSHGSRVVPCGRTDGRTDMTKLIVAFCNFANAPKILKSSNQSPYPLFKFLNTNNYIYLSWVFMHVIKIQTSAAFLLCSYFFMAREPLFGQNLIIFEVSRSHTVIHNMPRKNPIDEWSARRIVLNLTKQNICKEQTSKLRRRFEPTIPASERLQTHALDRATPGIVLSSCANPLLKSVYRILRTYRRCHLHVTAVQTSASFILRSCSLALLYHRSCSEICLLSWITCSTKHLIKLLHNSFVSVN
jgi:hypothetical protein